MAPSILLLTKTTQTTADGKQYITFNGDLEEIVPCSYTIQLRGNLFSNQHNRNTLVIDKEATNEDITRCPVLEFIPPDPETVLEGEDSDPYLSGASAEEFFYSGNLGFDGEGRVRYIDTFDPETLGTSFMEIRKWEEYNASVNYLKTPVTIAQSSSSTQLYEAVTAPGNTTYTINNGTKLEETTVDSTVINYNHEVLIKKITSYNQIVHAIDRSGSATVVGSNKVNVTNNLLTIPTIQGPQGIAVAFSGQKINISTHINSIKFKGRVLGLVGYSGNCKVFGALVRNANGTSTTPEIISCRILEEKYANFLFELDLDVQTVLVKDTCYLVMGIICDTAQVSGSYPTITNVTVRYDAITINSTNSLSAEKIFTLSDIGVNVNLDYNVSPYLYCAKKIVSCPYVSILPKATNTTFPGTSNSSTYFSTFNNNKTYVKSWNDLFKVLGKNHFKDASDNTRSEVIVDYNSKYNTSHAGFKYVNSLEYNDTNKSIVTHNTLSDESDESYIAFCWYKQYTKSNNAETNVTYYPEDPYDLRSETTKEVFGNGITYAKTSDGKYLFGGTNGQTTFDNSQIKVQEEQVVHQSKKIYRKRHAIFFEAADLANATHIEYGSNDGTGAIYDFKTQREYELSYSLYLPNDLKGIILTNGSTSGAVTIDTPATDKEINVDSKVSVLYKSSGSNNALISTFSYLVMKFQMLENNGEPIQDKYYYEVYQIKKDCQYVTGFTEPGNLGSTSVLTENSSGGSVTTTTVDETMQEADKVYIPTTARNVILEVTHVTTENNTIGIFYANKFDDLGILHSGCPTKEWPDPAYFSTDIILNPSYDAPFVDVKYTSGKLTLGKSISTVNGTKFHTLDAAGTGTPSAYSSAPNEKCLMNTSATETRVIEVPLHKIPGSDTRHFALRFANVRPSNADILNQLVVRVIGYRA